MKRDYREIWWKQDAKPEEEGLTFIELAIGLLFLAAILFICIAGMYL